MATSFVIGKCQLCVPVCVCACVCVCVCVCVCGGGGGGQKRWVSFIYPIITGTVSESSYKRTQCQHVVRTFLYRPKKFKHTS